MPVVTPDLITKIRGVCQGGTINLSRYPSLCYAPLQHGEGVRTHLQAKPVDDIAVSAVGSGLVALIDAEMAKHGVDIGELLNAIEYCRELGLI